MYTVYLRLARNASSEQREAELEQQFSKGRQDPLNQRTLLEGEGKSPWPGWLQNILGKYGWQYDHYNWLYLKYCRTQAEAFREQAWALDLGLLLASRTLRERLGVWWRMKNPGLLNWAFSVRTPEAGSVALRMDPTILQDVTMDGVPGAETGTGTGDEGALA
jgi:hypothetical protein